RPPSAQSRRHSGRNALPFPPSHKSLECRPSKAGQGECAAMSQQETVSFQSAGLRLHGVLSVPDGGRPAEKRAAFLVVHGFGSNGESPTCVTPARVLNEFGFVTLRFDMRGCGKSEGEFGRVICLEQVE